MPKVKDKNIIKKELKPVSDNSTPCSDLQFQVKKDVEGYKKPKKLNKKGKA